MTSNDVPKCNRCDARISWNKDRRAELNTTRPLTLDNSKVHVCEEVTNNQDSSHNNSIDNSAMIDQTSHLQQIEGYSLTQVEQLSRLTDLLVTEKDNTDLIAQYLRAIGNSLTTQERILEQILTEIQKQEPQVEGSL